MLVAHDVPIFGVKTMKNLQEFGSNSTLPIQPKLQQVVE